MAHHPHHSAAISHAGNHHRCYPCNRPNSRWVSSTPFYGRKCRNASKGCQRLFLKDNAVRWNTYHQALPCSDKWRKIRPGIWNCGCASRNCILNQHPDKGAGKEIPGEVSKSIGYYNDMRVKRYFTPLIIIIN